MVEIREEEEPSPAMAPPPAEEVEAEEEGETTPLIPTKKTVKTKVPEVEIRLYRQGKGPIEVFRSALGGWDQDQLEVLDILDKYGLKALFAFNPESGRGAPIRFNHKNGRSVLSYSDGAVILVDGEPKVRSSVFIVLEFV